AVRTFMQTVDSANSVSELEDKVGRLVLATAVFESELEVRRSQGVGVSQDLEALYSAFVRIDELIEGPGGIRPLLDTFEINVKHVLRRLYDSSVTSIRKRGVKIVLTERYPDDAIMVFAEEAPLFVAMRSVMENVIRHAKASRA